MKTTDQPVSRVEDIMADAGEQTLELPGWAEGKPFIARRRRASLLDMARSGKVPNHLMGAVMELYQKGNVSQSNMKVVGETMLCIAEQALVSPTLAELTEARIELTDRQATEIYIFAMQGVDALRPFRKKQSVLAGSTDRSNVASAAQQLAADQ